MPSSGSVFELTLTEWADSRELLLRARTALHDLLAPDGYLIGWNQGSTLRPHMRVIPRFDDEPLAALGGQRPGKQGGLVRRPAAAGLMLACGFGKALRREVHDGWH